ncbi:MAG: hypothetical protein ACQEXC_15380, partial [Pseudomonadota bacterium]
MEGRAGGWLVERPILPRLEGRIEAIDLARGIAIALMILTSSPPSASWEAAANGGKEGDSYG